MNNFPSMQGLQTNFEPKKRSDLGQFFQLFAFLHGELNTVTVHDQVETKPFLKDWSNLQSRCDSENKVLPNCHDLFLGPLPFIFESNAFDRILFALRICHEDRAMASISTGQAVIRGLPYHVEYFHFHTKPTPFRRKDNYLPIDGLANDLQT